MKKKSLLNKIECGFTLKEQEQANRVFTSLTGHKTVSSIFDAGVFIRILDTIYQRKIKKGKK